MSTLSQTQTIPLDAPTRRLVVLIPGQAVDEIKLSRAIRAIPGPAYLDVLLLSLVHNEEEELAARRCLATIATYLRDFQTGVEFQVCWQGAWVKALGGLLQPGDLLVVPPELSVPAGLGKRRLLVDSLSALARPIYPLPGFFRDPVRPGMRRLLLRLAYWGVLVLILAGFFNLESAASLATPGSLGHLLTILVMVVEFGAVYFWTVIAG